MSFTFVLYRTHRLCLSLFMALPAIAMANDKPSVPLGLVEGSTYAYKDMQGCSGSNGKTLFERMPLALAGNYHCKPRYGDEAHYLVGYYGGQRFFVPVKDVFLTDEAKSRLPELDDNALATQDFDRVKQDSQAYRLLGLKEAQKAYESTAKYGIGVETFSVYDQSEYTDATGFELKVFNPTKKRIKYVVVELIGMNAVDDPVRGSFTRNAVKRVRGVGPIEPESSASYTFDNLWFTDLVEWPKLVSLKVEYMDGSSKVVKSLKQVQIEQVHQDVSEWPGE